MMFMNLSDIAILNINGADYCCIISEISKSNTTNIVQNNDFTEKKRIIVEDKNLLSQIKMVEEIITFGEIEKYKFYSYF